jgi:putative heme-binding domain-containing protein
LASLWRSQGSDPTVTRWALKLGSAEAYASAMARMADPQQASPLRLAFIAAVAQSGGAEAVARLLPLLDEPSETGGAIRLAVLTALEHFSDDAIGTAVLDRYPSFSSAEQARAIGLLCSRQSWAAALVQRVKRGSIDTKQVSVDQIRQMLAHDDAALAQAIEAVWGKVRIATPGEKQAYVPVLGRVLNEGRGDPAAGRALFAKHCGVCHTLHGEGNKIGPDLTASDRRNREALLVNILDPSGYVRPEYVAQTAVLNDGRVLTGLVVESSAQQITLVDAKNQKTTVARSELEQIQPSPQSLMPERLLEPLAPQELRDLFGYLQSDAPPARAEAN